MDLDPRRLQVLSDEGEIKATRELLRTHRRNNDYKALKEFQEHSLRMLELWAQLARESLTQTEAEEPENIGHNWETCLSDFGAIRDKPHHKWHLVRPRWGTTLCGKSFLLSKVPEFISLLYYSSVISYHRVSNQLLSVNFWTPSIIKRDTICLRCVVASSGRYRSLAKLKNLSHEEMRKLNMEERVDLWWREYLPIFYGITNA